MTSRPPKELQAQLRANIDSHYEDRKRELVRDLELEHQEAIREFERWVNGKSSNMPLPQQTPTASKQRRVASNCSSDRLTLRQMVEKVVPEFQDDDFTSSQIRERILERWPNITHTQLRTHIGQLLKGMYEDGKLDRFGKGPRIQDPWKYRVRENQQEMPLGP